jgi:meiotic recombination protein DMC1
VIADSGGSMFITDPKKPAGGHVLVHATTIRHQIDAEERQKRAACVQDLMHQHLITLPEGEAISFCFGCPCLLLALMTALLSELAKI